MFHSPHTRALFTSKYFHHCHQGRGGVFGG